MKKLNLAVERRTPSPDRLVMPIRVTIRSKSGHVVADYVMDHNSPTQRAVLCEQVKYALSAKQSVLTQAI